MTHGLRALLLTAIVAETICASVAAPRDALIGKAAPDFQVTTVDGRKLTLADFKGEVLVLNFWATWCAPCKKELPTLDSFYRIQQPAGLRVLAVTTENSLPLTKLRALAAALAIPMAREFKGDYGPLKGVPTNYVIDRDGILRYAKAGALSLDGMNAILVPLLRADAAAHEPGALRSAPGY
jgi:thiol-disulfide isomerase/thioredoxin